MHVMLLGAVGGGDVREDVDGFVGVDDDDGGEGRRDEEGEGCEVHDGDFLDRAPSQ